MSIEPSYWGQEYASSTTAAVKGVCNRWKNDEKKILYINWDGYQKAQQAHLVAMDTDDHGNSFDFKLLPGADGTMPTLYAPNRCGVQGKNKSMFVI